MIGLTFVDELKNAGITDWRFSWGVDGKIEFHPEVAKEERDKVMAVYKAHDPDATPAS